MGNLFVKKGFIKSENGYLLKIHNMIWLEIDHNGFCELRRKSEFERKRHQYDKITLPKPVRCKNDLDKLLVVLEY